MTRLASVLAVALAVFVGTAPWTSGEPTLSMTLSLAGAVLLLVAGHGAFRHRPLFHILLLLTAFVVLGRFLPSLFINQRYWPDLAIIFLAVLTLGFGLIGFVLDRYSGGHPSSNGVAS